MQNRRAALFCYWSPSTRCAQRSTVQETAAETAAGTSKDDIAVTPLAIPMLAGPAAISTVILWRPRPRPGPARSITRMPCTDRIGELQYISDRRTEREVAEPHCREDHRSLDGTLCWPRQPFNLWSMPSPANGVCCGADGTIIALNRRRTRMTTKLFTLATASAIACALTLSCPGQSRRRIRRARRRL